MLDDLGTVDWGTVRHAYGPAVDIPDRLLNLARGAEGWERDFEELQSAVFHQGTYDESTPLVVPFLLDMLEVPAAPCAALLIFLADLSAGHLDVGYEGWDPYAWRSTPEPPVYPEAFTTIVAVWSGFEIYVGLLGHVDPSVRGAAAVLLAGLPDKGDAGATVRTGLEAESDPGVRASLVLCLGRLRAAGEVSDAARITDCLEDPDELVRTAAAVALAEAPPTDSDERVMTLLTEGAGLPYRTNEGFSWNKGNISGMAIGALAAMTSDVATEALRTALVRRLSRGEMLTEYFDAPPFWDTLEDEAPADTLSSLEGDDGVGGSNINVVAKHIVDENLRALASALAAKVFHALGDRRDDPLLLEELDDEQRATLRITVEHGLALPVPGIPWFDADRMERFLTGGGPLDEPLQVEALDNGRAAPIWKWLYRISNNSLDEVATRQVLDAISGQREPEEVFDLCCDLFTGAYVPGPAFGFCLEWHSWSSLLARLEPHDEHLEDMYRRYARELLAKDDRYLEEAFFAVRPLVHLALKRDTPIDDHLDPLLSLAICDRLYGRALAEALPEERRAVLIARIPTSYIREGLADLAESQPLIDETVRAVLEPSWRTSRSETELILLALGEGATPALERAIPQARGKKQALFRSVVAQLRDGGSDDAVD